MGPGNGAEPSRKLAVVTCMDCRIDPLAVLGLEVGEAHVIRNAGAIVTADTRRSLALSQRALGTTEIWIVMHTECGVLGLDDEAFVAQVRDDTGQAPDWAPGGFASLEEGLREGIEQVRAERALLSTDVRGFVLDIRTLELTEVDAAG